MATYKQIQEYIKGKYSFTVKTCWIAHMKEVCGLPVKVAPNRSNINIRQVPCPIDKQEFIKEAFKHFGMID